MAELLFPLQFKRQYSAPLDADMVFTTSADMNTYLTNPLRYAGQVATCLSYEGKLYILNNAKTAWQEVSGGSVSGNYVSASNITSGYYALANGTNSVTSGSLKETSSELVSSKNISALSFSIPETIISADTLNHRLKIEPVSGTTVVRSTSFTLDSNDISASNFLIVTAPNLASKFATTMWRMGSEGRYGIGVFSSAYSSGASPSFAGYNGNDMVRHLMYGQGSLFNTSTVYGFTDQFYSFAIANTEYIKITSGSTQFKHTVNIPITSGILKTTTGNITSAVAGVDYQSPLTSSTSASVLDGTQNWKTLFGSDGKILSTLYTSGSAGTMDHNSLSGIQGGTSNQYYHLTSASYNAVSALNSSDVTNWNSVTNTVNTASANWNTSYSIVNNTSATWNSQNNHTHLASAITNFNTTVSSITSAVYQPLDSTLTSLAGYNTNGLMTQVSADAFTGRTIVSGSTKVNITNGNGVNGNPTIDIVQANMSLSAIGGMLNVIQLNTTGTANSTTVLYGDGAWRTVSGGGDGPGVSYRQFGYFNVVSGVAGSKDVTFTSNLAIPYLVQFFDVTDANNAVQNFDIRNYTTSGFSVYWNATPFDRTVNWMAIDGSYFTIGQASSATSGFLTSQDWTTFNNKAGKNLVGVTRTGDATTGLTEQYVRYTGTGGHTEVLPEATGSFRYINIKMAGSGNWTISATNSTIDGQTTIDVTNPSALMFVDAAAGIWEIN